ncbi:MAG: ABC transporter ATP-binding protein [Verrucomicrobiales bacterium]|nr:ABC transporter ATP-binding protein [Verrucomicrobiales bacterium]
MFDFLSKLWRLTLPYRGRLILGILFGVIAGVMEAALVIVIYVVFAAVFPTDGGAQVEAELTRLQPYAPDLVAFFRAQLAGFAQTPSTAAVVLLVSLIPLTMLARGVVGYLNAYLLNWVAVRTLGDLRARLLDHLLHLPLRMVQKFGTGELMSRLTSDVGALHNALAASFVSLVKDPVAIVAFLVVLLVKFQSLTLTALLVFPVCVVPVVIYARKLRKATERLQSDAAEVSQTMHQALSGVWLVKAYNLESTVIGDFMRRIAGYNSRWMRATRASEIPGPLIEVAATVGLAIMLGAVALRSGSRGSATEFMAFVMAIILSYQRVRSLIKLQNLLIQARAASRRVFELLETPSDLTDPPAPKPVPAGHIDVHFDRVSFSYDGKPAVEGIDLLIPAGKMVALVGPSGAGKSTLASLLLRFHDPQQGAVRLGGIDLRELAQKPLRDRMAVVSQDVVIFHDTIRYNIALGRPGATEAEIIAAAQHAHAHEFITAKPEGYDTVVGERGAALSGGQRQRIAIARALLRNAPILILDEATSALDTESERAVQAALDTLMVGRTTLCIAHRLSTIQRADLIVVLEHGRIADRGTHEELISRKGLYRRLFELQFGEPSPS